MLAQADLPNNITLREGTEINAVVALYVYTTQRNAT